MSQPEQPDCSQYDVWQRAADQASVDMQRARSHETARASFLEKLAHLQRLYGMVTTKEAEELWNSAKIAAALTK
jgi:hypothetical protein